MRMVFPLLTLLAMLLLSFAPMAAQELASPKGTVLVQAITSKDLPVSEGGKGAWEPFNRNNYCYDVAVFEQWVYAMSGPARTVVRFQRDTATGKLTYQDATRFEIKRPYEEQDSGCTMLRVRHLPDGQSLLYALYRGHKETTLVCYTIEAKTGALTIKGKADMSVFPMNDVNGGYGYPATVWSPDHRRLYYVGVKKIAGFTFGGDGIPIAEGKAIACKNPGQLWWGRGRDHAIMSPDGKNLYVMTQMVDVGKKVPAGTVFWQADVYDCNPETGSLTFNSSLELPNLHQGSGTEFTAFAPEGKTLYVMADDQAATYYALKRDPKTGVLSILSSGQFDKTMVGVGGPPWVRGGKFAISADGVQGFYLGSNAFGTCRVDPATGALSDFSSIPGKWTRFAFDGGAGNLFLVGGPSILSFKTASPKRP